MTFENKIHAVFVYQPGEVSSRNFRRGGGPAPESVDGELHPVIAKQCGIVAVQQIFEQVDTFNDTNYRSGHDFPGDIAFGD